MNEDKLHDARLHELAKHLGEAAAERLDVEATARAVVERLRAEPRARRWQWIAPAWLRIAATVVLVAGAGLVTRAVIRTSPGDDGHYVAEELHDLSADELRQLLASLDQTLDLDEPRSPDAGLQDLNEEQLRAVLRSLEG